MDDYTGMTLLGEAYDGSEEEENEDGSYDYKTESLIGRSVTLYNWDGSPLACCTIKEVTP